jgi:hypothetical protein
MPSKYAYAIYSWITTFLFGGLVYWIATIPNFEATGDLTNEVVKVLFRMVLYSFLFILFYRSLIATFKAAVQRLSHWRSKGEAAEDAEFVLIIETLLVIVSILSVSMFSIFEEYIQSFVAGRFPQERDVLVSIMAVLLTALVVYSVPVIGELEMAVKHYYVRRSKEVAHKKAK